MSFYESTVGSYYFWTGAFLVVVLFWIAVWFRGRDEEV